MEVELVESINDLGTIELSEAESIITLNDLSCVDISRLLDSNSTRARSTSDPGVPCIQ